MRIASYTAIATLALSGAALAEAHLAAADADGDGIVSASEFNEAFAARGAFGQFDLDGNGTLDQGEFAALGGNIADYDANGDGEVDGGEFEGRSLTEYDADGDGALNADEAAAFDADFAEGGRFFVAN